ncbi:MAG: CvpA family protein [Planctomycetaceae bacterium]|nr:CvpA family protein [Planctomycetaceae bacterium]
MVISIILLIILGAVTWSVASEGPWGATIMFFSVVFSGLLALNYFEPTASLLEGILPGTWVVHTDFISLVGLFSIFLVLFRVVTLYLLPSYIEVHPFVYEGGRWGFGVLTGYIAMGFVLLSLHTAPLPREFLGFRPERKNFFEISAPDRQWLGFMQYLSEKNFSRFGQRRIFDGQEQTGVIGVDNSIWPSFPIRYATRRDTYSRNVGIEYVDLGGGESEIGGGSGSDDDETPNLRGPGARRGGPAF